MTRLLRAAGWVRLAVPLAVLLVLLLAWLDLLRDQASALADFATDQAELATSYAATVRARLDAAASRADVHDAPTALSLLDPGPWMSANATQPPSMRWLAVDGGGRWLLLPARPSAAAWRTGWSEAPAEVQELLRTMAASTQGDRGAARTVVLGHEGARWLGLEPRAAIAAWAPVALPPGADVDGVKGRLTVGLVASAMRLRDRARVGVLRLVLSAGLTGLFVGLFGVAVMRQDRRARRLAEALRLADATAALRQRSEKIVASMPLGLLEFDEQLRVTAANPFLVGRGVPPIESPRTLAEALPRAGAAEIAVLEELLAGAHADRRPRERLGLRLRLGDDEPSDVDAHAIPLVTPLPGVEGFLLLHDRTEVRALERNLARAEKLATIGTLAAGVAHEVGTPLGIISGRAEQLLARTPDEPKAEPVRRGLSSILAQVDKVSTTIRQLLDFARVRPVEAVAVTPTQVLESAAALLEHRFHRAGVALSVSAPATVPAMAADPGQIEQVLVNLLMNACDACSEGGHVVARAALAEPDHVAIEIADDGSGIAPEHLPHVLDPFFTTKKRGHGTGLGLPIAADIVKNHGGTLEITSEPGRGTTVRIRLPTAAHARRGDASPGASRS